MAQRRWWKSKSYTGEDGSRWSGVVKPEKRFLVIEAQEWNWPVTLQLPSRRFRLFVAAHASGTAAQTISNLAFAALEPGMVYPCAWGPGCKRLHAIVDQVVVGDDIAERKFAGSRPGHVITTTWHGDENLEEAIDFLATCAAPTDGFAEFA